MVLAWVGCDLDGRRSLDVSAATPQLDVELQAALLRYPELEPIIALMELDYGVVRADLDAARKVCLCGRVALCACVCAPQASPCSRPFAAWRPAHAESASDVTLIPLPHRRAPA